MLLRASLVLLPLAGAAAVAADQPTDCKPYQPYISILKSFDLPFVSEACSSLLHYPSVHATRTVTDTVTRTQPTTVATVTSTVVTSKTTTKTRTRFSTTTSYETLTNTITSYHLDYVTKTAIYPGAVEHRDAPAYEPARPWEAFPIPTSILSQACSCYIPKPTSTTTTTVTSTTKRRVTATVKKTTTSVITTNVITTITFTDTQGIYTDVTAHPNSTLTIRVTSCVGANPTPSFNLQIVDSTPTRTDKYNLLFPSPTRAPGYDAFTYPFYFPAVFPSPPTSAGTGIFNIDCLGRLIAQKPGSRKPLYFATDYFQPNFEAIKLLTQEDIVLRGYHYVRCSIGVAGFLHCSLNQSPPLPVARQLQSCPVYFKLFGYGLVIGNYSQLDSPACYDFRFKVV